MIDVVYRQVVKDRFKGWKHEKNICEQIDAVPAATIVFGKWIKDNSIGMSPGGTPGYVCSQCGGSFHLHGAEYPKRKMICDKCGSINSYPWEKTYEQSNDSNTLNALGEKVTE